jgi:hypothetical protein
MIRKAWNRYHDIAATKERLRCEPGYVMPRVGNLMEQKSSLSIYGFPTGV